MISRGAEFSRRRDALFFAALRIRHDARSRSLLRLPLSTSSDLTFRRFRSLSSVVFIVCDVDDDVHRWRRFTQTHRVRPGRLAARLRVNVLLVISGLATSSPLCSSSFFSWSSARLRFLAHRPVPLPRPVLSAFSQPSNSICIAPSAVQARKLARFVPAQCSRRIPTRLAKSAIANQIRHLSWRDSSWSHREVSEDPTSI